MDMGTALEHLDKLAELYGASVTADRCGAPGMVAQLRQAARGVERQRGLDQLTYLDHALLVDVRLEEGRLKRQPRAARGGKARQRTRG